MPDTLDNPERSPADKRFAGRIEDLPQEDLEILANIDQRNKRAPQTLEDMLAQYDSTAPIPDELRAWLDAPPVGREII